MDREGHEKATAQTDQYILCSLILSTVPNESISGQQRPDQAEHLLTTYAIKNNPIPVWH